MLQQRHLVAFAVLLLVGCAMVCFAVQPVNAAAVHDCCPKPANDRDCPEMKGAGCAFNALDVPKASPLLLLLLLALTVSISPLLMVPPEFRPALAEDAPVPPQQLYLRNRVFRI